MRKILAIMVFIVLLAAANLTFAEQKSYNERALDILGDVWISAGYGQQYSGFGAAADVSLGFFTLGGGVGYFPNDIEGVMGVEIYGRGILPLEKSIPYFQVGYGLIGVEMYYSTEEIDIIYGIWWLLGNMLYVQDNIFVDVGLGMCRLETEYEYRNGWYLTFQAGLGMNIGKW